MKKALKRTLFVGEFQHSVDEKKRLAIPAKWLAAVSGTQEFYVLPVPEDHLYVVPESDMEEFLARLGKVSIGEYERRDALRLIAGGAQGTPVDKQGRILLTEKLLRHAGIQGEAVLVGVFTWFEIWSPAKYEKVNTKSAVNFAESAKQLGI